MRVSGILVIGGGVIGTTVGYGLAELGAQVNLLDQGGTVRRMLHGKISDLSGCRAKYLVCCVMRNGTVSGTNVRVDSCGNYR